MNERVLITKVLPVKGITRLSIGDTDYLETVEKGTPGDQKTEWCRMCSYNGYVKSAPMGLMILQRVSYEGQEQINVRIVTANNIPTLRSYSNNGWSPMNITHRANLFCEEGHMFKIETEFGSIEHFFPLAGNAGEVIIHNRFEHEEACGIILALAYDVSESFDSIIDELHRVFPELTDNEEVSEFASLIEERKNSESN